jgi:hypothetical protein
MQFQSRYALLSILITTVWLFNGLVGKVLGWVPRHQQIVGEILGGEYASLLTFLIGLAEIAMAVWVVSGWQRRLNASLQIAVVAIMNILEFILVPDLLLWGRFNAVFALLFIGLVYYHSFVLGPQLEGE